jgi:hypothetical protein
MPDLGSLILIVPAVLASKVNGVSKSVCAHAPCATIARRTKRNKYFIDFISFTFLHFTSLPFYFDLRSSLLTLGNA